MSAQIYFLMSSNIFCMFYDVQVMWLGMYSYVRVYYADNSHNLSIQSVYTVHQGFPDRGPRAQIWAPDRLLLGPLGIKYMH